MRVVVTGRMEREPWTDNEDQPRETWQINARSVGILPFRIESVTISPRQQETAQDTQPNSQAAQAPAAPKEPKRRKECRMGRRQSSVAHMPSAHRLAQQT